jgi:hypothetical protein
MKQSMWLSFHAAKEIFFSFNVQIYYYTIIINTLIWDTFVQSYSICVRKYYISIYHTNKNAMHTYILKKQRLVKLYLMKKL